MAENICLNVEPYVLHVERVSTGGSRGASLPWDFLPYITILAHGPCRSA